MAGLDATETGNELSQPTFEFLKAWPLIRLIYVEVKIYCQPNNFSGLPDATSHVHAEVRECDNNG